MWDGVKNAVSGNRIGDIANAIQTEVEGNGGYKVVRSLIGHGVGKSLHEEPEVPGFGKAGTGPVLKKGMTIAIEAIYTEGTSEVILAEDNWTISSADGTLGGLFEMSVIVLDGKAEVLTDWRKY
jgi:methionyl aminopeptidase